MCEGTKTEPNYFDSIRKLLPPNIVSLQIEGIGANTLSLVERARDLKDSRIATDYPFDQVWVVFDHDSFPPDAFDNAITSAVAEGMQCAWSNEAFELWYVLHFEYRDTATSREDFGRILSRYLNEPYLKNSSEMYWKLSRLGNQQQAIARARKLDEDFKIRQIPPSGANPCTTVYQLVEELNRYLPLESE
ncbi:MAG: RloB domain-containing protein [Chitinispirillaceae bacterium]|nr:RloB domain-containing protein [Chitinispirillaceae bacterium]